MALQYLLLAFLALQGVSCQSSYEVGSPDSFEDEFHKIVKELEEAIHAAIEDLVKLGKGIYEKLGEEIKEAIKNAKGEIESILEKALKKIEQIKDKAAALGEEALACVQKESGRIIELNQKTVQANVECAKKAHAAANDLLAEFAKLVGDAKTNLKKTIDQWNACTNVICKLGVIDAARKQLPICIGHFKDFLPKVGKFLKIQIPALQKCVLHNMEKHNKGMTKIVNDIETCINSINGVY